MSSSVVNTFFNQNPKYLNDIYGINYVQNYEAMSGWTDFTGIFCDSMMLWCIYDLDDQDLKDVVESFITIIYGILKFYFKTKQYRIKPITKGIYITLDKQADYLVKETGWNAGYKSINITFHDVDFSYLLLSLEKVITKFRKNNILLRSIDVTVDCGRISTRKLIEEYLFAQNLIASKKDIADKHQSVGDNCISFNQYSSVLDNSLTRVKIYNKFIQTLESCQILQNLGSRLSHLVADKDTTFTDKVKHFREVGYSRIEITVYGSTLFSPDKYMKEMDKVIKRDLACCPTFKVPLQKQWNLVVDKLTQFVAVYVEDTHTFAYCHWWNSFTKRKQGICKSKIDKDMLEILLANFSFNDRPIHLFYIKPAGNSYDIINHVQYRRDYGSTAMTLVPGLSNTLFPSRSRLETAVIMFKDVGLGTYKNVYIEWPDFRLDQRKDKTIARLIKVHDSFDLSTMKEALPVEQTSLIKIEQPQSSKYKSDYSCLEVGATYTVRKYGYSLFRYKECLHFVLNDDIMMRCSNEVRSLMEPKIKEDVPFKFKVTKISRLKNGHKVECKLL